MIVIILYTMLLLFTDRTLATAMCLQALKQWYETMIPALFPMMLFSNILVDTGFAAKIGRLLNRSLLRFLHISDQGCYCLVTGFFFGFPMGAKTCADLYQKKAVTQKEAEYLLCFVNCIGPMYTRNLIHTRFPAYPLRKLLFGMYLLPLAYAVLLRYTRYRTCHFSEGAEERTSFAPKLSLTDALYQSVPKCGASILALGGYMILFQVSFISLRHFLASINFVSNALYPLLEITGGFFLLPKDTPLSWLLFCGTLGGACCMLQTYSFLKPAGLRMRTYVLHKVILACISFVVGSII